MITPDFSENPKLPPGTYPARVISCELKTSKTGSSYLNWKFETETRDNATNRKWVYLGTALTGKGAQMLKTIVRATINPGYEGGAIDTDKCVGCAVMITIDKQYNPDGTESQYPLVMDVKADPDSFDGFEG
jgi:hypothetical protein